MKKSMEELREIREKTLEKIEMRTGTEGYRIVVGMATCGIASGARPVLTKIMEENRQTQYHQCYGQTDGLSRYVSAGTDCGSHRFGWQQNDVCEYDTRKNGKNDGRTYRRRKCCQGIYTDRH